MEAEKPYTATYRDELALTHHFVSVLEQRLAGRDTLRRTNVHPLDWCHLGVLGPAKLTHAPVDLDAQAVEAEPDPTATPTAAAEAKTEGSPGSAPAPEATKASTAQDGEASEGPPPVVDRPDERDSLRRPPSAIGFEILVEPDAEGCIELLVDAAFCIFTKHLPTWTEHTNVLGGGVSAGAPLAEVTQRWPLDQKEIRLRVQARGPATERDDGCIQQLLDQTMATAFSRSDAERVFGTRPKVTQANAATEASFNAYLQGIVAGLPVENWSLNGSVEMRATPRPDGKVRVGCYFRNQTPETPPMTKGKGLKDAYKVISDVRLDVAITRGSLHPIEILPVPQDYQYDRRVWGVGHNTSVRVDPDEQMIATAALATYEQPRIVTREIVRATFAALDMDPFDVLGRIYDAMLAYEKDWQERILDDNALKLDARAKAECERDLIGFHDEIRRFASGIAALQCDDRLLTAFKAANRVFGRLAVGYDAWRLFQVAFIVTQLPGLAIREGHSAGEYPPGEPRDWKDVLDWGDVLWFRTGGGKTEAYLGLACCAMLYDRLRGKRFGVTAWLRFPLRMLSIQQLQRAMRVIWETEKERVTILGAKADESDPIRLGYFVGGSTTPNQLSEEEIKKYATPESLERLRVVPDCPECRGRGTVKVTADAAALRFRHACDKCGSELPLDISDDEVYRSLSTLIVGTVDKMASVGQQMKFGLLWGGVKWKCPQHGYAFGDHCCAYPCKVDKKQRKKITAYDGAPALHIQDELHLLQEELGAFSGHYETLIRHCEATVGSRPSKIVAATATIEGFENQVRHLYGVRGARRFPGRGYDKLRSFYAEPDFDQNNEAKTARIFVAFRSPSLPPADASAFCSEILHEEIGNLFRNPHEALAFLEDAQTDAHVAELLRYYTTTLNYVGSLAKGSKVAQALGEASSKVRQGGRDLNVEYTSGRTTSAEVAEIVHRIESPPAWQDGSFLDALVATSMISHGVDLERVNLMTMDGVPDSTAEYIQASSRSGRRHVGMVIVVLAAFSLRASSIYHRFLEYHAHLDRMVTPVPVNRFAKYAAQRTMPGIAIGLIYGMYAPQANRSMLKLRNEVAVLLKHPDTKFLEHLRKAYALGDDIYDARLEQALSDTLRSEYEKFELAVRTSTERDLRNAVRPAPMTSLRDVEAGVPFWPERGDSKLLAFIHQIRD